MIKPNEQIAGYLNMDATDEVHVFLKSTYNKKVTAQSKYNAFVTASLQKVAPLIKAYIEAQYDVFTKCNTVEQVQDLNIEVLPANLRKMIVNIVDKQKNMDLVEKTYVCLDLWRAVTTNIGSNIGKLAMTRAKAIQEAKIANNKPNGRIIIP